MKVHPSHVIANGTTVHCRNCVGTHPSELQAPCPSGNARPEPVKRSPK